MATHRICIMPVSALLSMLLFFGCTDRKQELLFTSLSADHSGIHFVNTIREDDSTDSFIDEFGYMGGGVGIGDFNNDGFKDIFFTGNQTSCRLYLNSGDNTFRDITTAAGLTTHVWATGVSIVDINNDGYDDIYVCTFGRNLQQRSANLLFINQHDNTFKEEAAAYGLADTGYSTQAVFLDYDRDGDLDMYLSNYLLNGPNANTVFPKDLSGRSPANDKLYRNDGVSAAGNHPGFTEVSMAANIKDCGYGLGVVASDLNRDGWPDIYVADDFISDDLLWLNNKNGSFTDRLSTATKHTSYSSMGVDAADINNDGLPDILTLDMLPENNERRKTTFSLLNYERYELERSFGYHPQFMRNMLQLNTGAYSHGDTLLPQFSEIGRLAGVSATDWSWSVLLADFDNDGWKDIHITNGIGRDFINADFLEFSSSIFSGVADRNEQRRLIREKLHSLQHIDLPNYLYLNNHDYTFSDISKTSGIAAPSMSNGAAYVDLDNDGDLDLVVNNINSEAAILLNNTIKKGQPVLHHSISVDLQGTAGNRHGFGARIDIYSKDLHQTQEQSPVRGYFSSVDQRLVFGLGSATTIDSLLITWPDGWQQHIGHCRADTLLMLRHQDAIRAPENSYQIPPAPFADLTNALQASYRHKDIAYNDYTAQRLLPQKYSQLGPFICTGDINNDGLTDFFIGGGFNSPGGIFLQHPDGRFTQTQLTDSVKMEEDAAAVIFDADGDGDNDLLVTNGDTRYPDGSSYYTPRLYLNDGKGNFQLASNAIPAQVSTIAGCVTICDIDGDKQPDLFIGGRVSAQYPLAPRSYVLHNNKGHFTDITAAQVPELLHPGMITAATWADLDGDGQPELTIAGEWMPIRSFTLQNGKLQPKTIQGLEHTEGMWRSLVIADVDNDGDPDLIAGNLGLNCDYLADSAHPMQVFAKDLDGNGIVDPIPFYYLKDNSGERHAYPSISRSMFAKQVPAIRRRFLYNKDYANAGQETIFHGWSRDGMLILNCTGTGSCWFENKGHGSFVKHLLPAEAQFAPVNAIICADLDGDGYKDLLLGGNEYQTEVMTGRYDASYGCLLKGSAEHSFTASKGSPLLQGDIKSLALLPAASGQSYILAGINNDSLRIFGKTTVQQPRPALARSAHRAIVAPPAGKAHLSR